MKNEDAPTPAAERMRLCRQRRREGMRCLTIEIHEEEINALVARGFLNFDQKQDSSAVTEALYRFFESDL